MSKETNEMTVDNNYYKLAQYCTVNVYCENSNRVLDSLEDVNYQLPMDISLKPFLPGSTPLHLAFHFQKLDDVKNLLKRGADFTIKNGNGQTVLHQALQLNCVDAGQKSYILIDKLLADSYIPVILSAHVDKSVLKNPCNGHGISHFHIACMSNYVKAVEFFLKNGVSAKKAIDVDSNILPGYSPLHIAARYSALETVQVLLEYGADISHKDVNGMTALHLLIEHNMKLMNRLDVEKPEIYKKLKPDIEINEKIINMLLAVYDTNDCMDLSPLQIACTMQDSSRAKQLLENADLHSSVSMNSIMWPGYTALHFAAHFSIDTVKLLLQKGADILAKDANSVTPFDLCVGKFNIEDIYNLITSQQNLSNINFSDGKTKLSHFIFAMYKSNTFKSFIQNISDFNMYIPFDSPLWPGYTLLHLAIVFLRKDEDFSENIMENADKDGKELEEIERIKRKLNVEDIKLFLEKGIDVTLQDIRGRTPLHLAFRLTNKNVVDLLLQAQKKIVNPTDDDGLSHLHIAVAFGNKALTETLLKAHKTDIDKPVKSNFQLYMEDRSTVKMNADSTALHIAIAKRDKQITKLLIKSGADVYTRDECDLTPIHLIIYLAKDDCYEFKDIIEEIDNLEDRVVESTGLNHLHVATCLASVNVVKNLLDHGANVESRITSSDSLPFLKDFENMTPLQLALKFMWLDIIELLIDRGAEILVDKPVNADLDREKSEEFLKKLKHNIVLRQRLEQEIGVTLLHFACASLDVEVAQEAINKGADVNVQTHKDSPFWPGCTPLHVAVSTSKPDMERLELLVKLLLNHDAQVTLMDIRQETPIHLLYYSRRYSKIYNPQIVDWLLEAQRNFNVNSVSRVGLSHFHVACARNCVKVIEQFLDHGVDLNCQTNYFDFEDNGGVSPLHLTMIRGSDESRDLLLDHAADLNLANCHGNTPLHWAVQQYPDRIELLQRMISAGADVMAVNIEGETPFEMLLYSGEAQSEIIEMIMNKGIHANSFNPVTEEGYLAVAFFRNTIYKEGRIEMGPVFEVMMTRHDLAFVDDKGRNAIHNLVSYKQEEEYGLCCPLITDGLVCAIDRLIKIGCNVDHQDEQGRTPLHIATQSRNYEAVGALFNCGANVNIIDRNEKPAFVYTSEYDGDRLAKGIINCYRSHFWRLSYFEFDLSQVNMQLYREIPNVSESRRDSETLYEFEYKEIEKIKNWQIGSSSMKLYDLMKDEGVAAYTMMKRDDRLAVDEFFQSDRLREEVWDLTGYLLLRYNQARVDLQTRLSLIDPAKDSLNLLANCDVPDVCACIILGFLTVKQLKNLISSVFDFE